MKNKNFFGRIFFMSQANVFHGVFPSHSVNGSAKKSRLQVAGYKLQATFHNYSHPSRQSIKDVQKTNLNFRNVKQTIQPLTFNCAYRQTNFKRSTLLFFLFFVISITKSFSQQIPLDIAVQNRYNEIT